MGGATAGISLSRQRTLATKRRRFGWGLMRRTWQNCASPATGSFIHQDRQKNVLSRSDSGAPNEKAGALGTGRGARRPDHTCSLDQILRNRAHGVVIA
jgi:hypothetical protein